MRRVWLAALLVGSFSPLSLPAQEAQRYTIRLAELGLLLAPLAAYLLWHFATRHGEAGPSRQALALILVVLLLFGAGLVWFGVHERAPPGTRYVPAELRDGRIVPGHRH